MVALETNYIVCVTLQHLERLQVFGMCSGPEGTISFNIQLVLQLSEAAGSFPKFYHQMTFTKQRIGIFALAIHTRDICHCFV